jgi:hypothetical protein
LIGWLSGFCALIIGYAIIVFLFGGICVVLLYGFMEVFFLNLSMPLGLSILLDGALLGLFAFLILNKKVRTGLINLWQQIYRNF